MSKLLPQNLFQKFKKLLSYSYHRTGAFTSAVPPNFILTNALIPCTIIHALL